MLMSFREDRTSLSTCSGCVTLGYVPRYCHREQFIAVRRPTLSGEPLKDLLKVISALALVVFFTAGCANRMSVKVDPSAKLDSLKTLHVVKLDKDGRGVDILIADNLRTRGYSVTTGAQPPSRIDALVTYADKWMWDITMYMLELTIIIREPKSQLPLATGNSYHTSLTRKSPTEMVDEVVNNIVKEAKSK
jgi:hypothetical protein